MSKSTIWQNFGQRNQSEAFEELGQDEFRESLPMEADDKGLLDAKTPRRDFLKYLGFSTAAASLAASCEMPVTKSIPFVNKPDNIIPGVSNYYATTFTQDGDVLSVLAKVRDGRPIKIEGNDLSPITAGGTSARAQASVLDLYDTARLRHPARLVEGRLEEMPTMEAFDKAVADEMAKLNGAPVVILTSTITSPTTKQLVGEFLAKYPGSRHVTYDAVSMSGMLLANEASFGQKAIPSYHFENAKVIVSLGADFLGTWLSPVEFTHQYAKGRRIDEKNISMSKHFQFESILSMTGANADERFPHKPSETGRIALALYNAVSGAGAVSGLSDKVAAGIKAAAAQLKAANGEAVVVSGSNDVNVQLVVNAINSAIGAYGKTINWAVTSNYRQGVDADMLKLVEDMNAGAVGALLIAGANPAYDHPAADKFKAGLKKVKFSVSFNTRLDETTELCTFSLPDHHYLESWGDAEPKSGHQSFIQPTINPLFKTRQWQDSLLKWSGAGKDYATYFKEYWLGILGSQENWDATLRAGLRFPAETTVSAETFNAVAVGGALAALGTAPAAGQWEVAFYQKVAIGNGSQATNPWLQEMPDPVTKATWDNYAMISAAAANELFGIDIRKNGDSDSYEVNPQKPMIKVTVNGKSLELPILIIPGTDAKTIGIALGYGRSPKVGVAAQNCGKNAYPLATLANGAIHFAGYNATVEKLDETYAVAQNQVYNYYQDSLGVKRVEVVKETSLANFTANKEMFKHDRDHLVSEYAKKSGDYRNEGSLYDPRLNDRPGIHWGMSIDLNTCFGCGACVVACNAENNIPVVGKTEVMRGHEMHWLRIDRYFVGDKNNPDEIKDVVFMPMMCQHCDNAPCENVCPVAATNHSSEGLNQMTYNRCIGTRYCANNCPFKVRRFNWADYTGADSFADNQRGIISDVTMDMNDDLVRMVLNPDVTVRSRGVIEKCSFCVQRLQAGKLEAKKAGRPVKDGEVKTACQSACPTNAIVFGDANDKESKLAQQREHSPLRMYYALEQIHVLPNVNYLAKIRNTDEIDAKAAHANPAAHNEVAH